MTNVLDNESKNANNVNDAIITTVQKVKDHGIINK